MLLVRWFCIVAQLAPVVQAACVRWLAAEKVVHEVAQYGAGVPVRAIDVDDVAAAVQVKGVAFVVALKAVQRLAQPEVVAFGNEDDPYFGQVLKVLPGRSSLLSMRLA